MKAIAVAEPFAQPTPDFIFHIYTTTYCEFLGRSNDPLAPVYVSSGNTYKLSSAGVFLLRARGVDALGNRNIVTFFGSGQGSGPGG